MHKIGLTLGKFAPFHKGHEYLVETALKEVDELYVIVYDTSVTTIPLQVRAGWITALFPKVNIIEAWDGPQSYGNSDTVKKEQEDYILDKIGDLNVTHFYSSEFYGEHMSEALGAIDRRVDESRHIVPISATTIRENTFMNRHFLSDLVYQDLIIKVCFLGAPSTGKSTISKVLAERYATQYMSEYGAEYWFENQIEKRLTLQQLDEIAQGHIQREEQLLLKSNNYLFSDTCPITTYVFSKDYHGKVGEKLNAFAQQSERRYDLFFLCDTDIPYDDTWDRSGPQKREWFQRQIIGDLKERRLPYFVLSGSLEQRIKKVADILENYHKYDNLAQL